MIYKYIFCWAASSQIQQWTGSAWKTNPERLWVCVDCPKENLFLCLSISSIPFGRLILSCCCLTFSLLPCGDLQLARTQPFIPVHMNRMLCTSSRGEIMLLRSINTTKQRNPFGDCFQFYTPVCCTPWGWDSLIH